MSSEEINSYFSFTFWYTSCLPSDLQEFHQEFSLETIKKIKTVNLIWWIQSCNRHAIPSLFILISSLWVIFIIAFLIYLSGLSIVIGLKNSYISFLVFLFIIQVPCKKRCPWVCICLSLLQLPSLWVPSLSL